MDENAEFLFVPRDTVMDVAEREGAIPYDVPGVELGHMAGRCSFESILLRYGLPGDLGLVELAKIVHAADICSELGSAPEGPGLRAIAHGFALVHGLDDHRKLELGFPIYDALYAWCPEKIEKGRRV